MLQGVFFKVLLLSLFFTFLSHAEDCAIENLKAVLLSQSDQPTIRGKLAREIELEFEVTEIKSKQYVDMVEALWFHEFDEGEFLRIIDRLSKGKTKQVTKEELKKLKELRKFGNVLRAALKNFTSNHEAPAEFDRFITKFGKLNDAIESGVDKKIIKEANRLQLLEYTYFGTKHKVAKNQQVIDFLNLQRDEILEMSQNQFLSSKEFHELRKKLKVFLNLFSLEQSVYPAAEKQAKLHEFYRLNEQLGDVHDKLVKKHLKGKATYEEQEIKIGNGLREKIHTLTKSLHFLAD